MAKNWKDFARQIVGGSKEVNSEPSSAAEPARPKLTMSEATYQAIDIGKQQIGTVYAKALLGATAKDNSADTVVQELGGFVNNVLGKLPEFQALLESPRVSVEEKSGLLDRSLNGRVSKNVLQFLKVVCEHERLDCLTEIFREVRRLHNEAKKVVQVQVTTAQPMDANVYGRMLELLKQKFGDDLDVDTRVDEKLIGGVVVRVGDQVFDGSVVQKMQSLRDEAVAKAVEKMRSATEQFASSS